MKSLAKVGARYYADPAVDIFIYSKREVNDWTKDMINRISDTDFLEKKLLLKFKSNKIASHKSEGIQDYIREVIESRRKDSKARLRAFTV